MSNLQEILIYSDGTDGMEFCKADNLGRIVTNSNKQKDSSQFIFLDKYRGLDLEKLMMSEYLTENFRKINPGKKIEDKFLTLSEENGISKRINSKISNQDLEELLEIVKYNKTPRYLRENGRYNQNSPYLELREITDYCNNYQLNQKKLIRHNDNYFEVLARSILVVDNPRSEEVERLKLALKQFQEGFTETQFGEYYLAKFLKQGWVIKEERKIDKWYNKFLKNLSEKFYPQKFIDETFQQTNQQSEISQNELAKYKLMFDIQLDDSHFGNNFRAKYFDTPFNFCLTYEGMLIASIGFNPIYGEVIIEQIQGIKGNRDKLSPFKWERALVSYVAEWAQQKGIGQVSIISVDNNKWAKRHGHLNSNQGKMLYDVTAKRSGFKKGEDGNYHKHFERHLHSTPAPENTTMGVA